MYCGYSASVNRDEAIPVNTDAVVSPDGTVTWVRPAIYTVPAHHVFRTNSWSSTYRFGSWSYDSSRLDLQPDNVIDALSDVIASQDAPPPIKMDTDNLVQTDGWSILDTRGRQEVRSNSSLVSLRSLVD